MYAIYGNIYHQYTPNVSIYTIHGSYGLEMFVIVRALLMLSIVKKKLSIGASVETCLVSLWHVRCLNTSSQNCMKGTFNYRKHRI